MTDQIFDDRARAFVDARERLEQADLLKMHYHQAVLEDRADPDQLPPEYWALIAEANVLAQLARAEAGVGYLAGAHAVEKKPTGRQKRRRIRGDVRAALAEAVKASAQDDEPPTWPAPPRATSEPPWRQGQIVRTTEGDYAGRTGHILEVHLSENEQTQVDVQLFPPGYPSDPATPIVLTVLSSQVELVDA